jgi:hypothetical protein
VDDLYPFEHNFLAGLATNNDLPSNGMVTSIESDHHREIDIGNFVERRGRLSIPSYGKRPCQKSLNVIPIPESIIMSEKSQQSCFDRGTPSPS